MMAIAVTPMIRPISARRSIGSGTPSASGEPGWNRSEPNRPAETMNRPSPAASIRYSGQWRRRASAGPAAGPAARSAWRFRAVAAWDADFAPPVRSVTSTAGSSPTMKASTSVGGAASWSARVISAAGLEAGIEGHAAVDVQRRAGDVVGLVRGQPHGRPRDVLGLADALVGDELQELGVGLGRLPRLAVDRRADRARADAVDPDAVRRDLLGDRLHHQHDAALGRRIVDVPRPGNRVVHRAHADDLASGAGDLLAHAAPLELAHRLAAAQELAGQVDVDHRVPVLQRHLIEGSIFLQAGVCDQDVNRAERIAHPGEHGLDLILLGHVCLDRDGVAAFLLDRADDLPGLLLTGAVVDDDVGAGPAERDRHGAPDPRAAAGDQGLLAGQDPALLAGRHDHGGQAVVFP